MVETSAKDLPVIFPPRAVGVLRMFKTAAAVGCQHLQSISGVAAGSRQSFSRLFPTSSAAKLAVGHHLRGLTVAGSDACPQLCSTVSERSSAALIGQDT